MKVIRSQHLSLDDGEVNFNLIEPAGVNRGVYQEGVGPTGLDALCCFLAAVSRAVTHDPENALG